MTVLIPNNVLTGDNANFEGGVGSWSLTAGTGSAVQDTAHCLDGTKCLKVTVTNSTSTVTVANSTAWAVSGGLRYSFEVPVWTASSGRTAQMTVTWLDQSAATIGTSVSGTFTLNAGSFGPVYVDAPAPANAATAKVSMAYTSVSAGDTFFADQVYFGPGRPRIVKQANGAMAGGTTGTLSYNRQDTSGGALVAFVSMDQGTSTTLKLNTITDAGGNVWTKVAEAYDNSGVTGSQGVAVWACSATIANPGTITATFSAAMVSAAIVVFEFSSGWAYSPSLIESSLGGTWSVASSAAVTSFSQPNWANLIGDVVISAIATRNANSTANPYVSVSGTTTTLFAQTAVKTTSGLNETNTSTWTFTSSVYAAASVAVRARPIIVSVTPSQAAANELIIAQSLTGYDTVTVNRADSSGAVAPVRSANGSAQVGDILSVLDYEQPLGSVSTYTVTGVCHNLDGSTTSATSLGATSTIPVTYGETWLKNISQPTLSRLVNVVGPMADVTRAPLNTTYSVLGTPYYTVVGDVMRARQGVLSLRFDTISALNDALTLLAPGSVLLFQATAADNFPDLYFTVTEKITEKRLEGPSASPYRQIDIPYTEVASPLGSFSLIPGNTWANVLSFTTWQNVLSWRSTWLGVLNIPYNSGSPH